MTVNSEFSGDVQKLVDYFDTEIERRLDFDSKYNDTMLRDRLDNLIETETGWNKIAVACRRMIICDRELDLKEGNELIDETIDDFKGLEDTYKEQPYEAIRYANTCGLISYRRGNYSDALDYFNQAKDMAEDHKYNMGCFIPDTTSNVIRTEFELFVRVLPKEIKKDYIQICENNFVEYIEEYNRAICESSKHEPDDGNKNLYLIYGHGIASLYHNLGEVYNAALDTSKKITNFEWGAIDLIRLDSKAKEANECSLEWGEKIGDTYRQLQSKRALSKLNVEKSREYEEDVLKGSWQRGKQIIYQKRIRESKNVDEAQGYINKDDFKLDETGDKIGILYNYDAIKEFLINSDVDLIGAKKGNNLTRLDIAQKKIDVAEDLRSELSPLLYKRQVINLIRDDVAYITHGYLDKGNYPKALDFSGKYSNRSLIELSEININRDSKVFSDQEKKISEYKTNILNIEADKKQIDHIDDCKKGLSTKLSTILSNETDEDFLKLIFAYEDILKQPPDSPVTYNIEDEDLCKMLIDRLKNIPDKENTVVLKFLAVEFKQKEDQPPIWWSLLIDRDGIKAKKVNLGDFEKWAHEVKDILKYFTENKFIGGGDSIKLFDKMSELSEDLGLYKKFDGVKNLFIIPDGELFQLPLHLLGENGHDLRKSMNVYYSPSLAQLLTSDIGNSFYDNEKASYLWVTSPTKDLYTTSNIPCLKKPDVEGIKTIECMGATLGSFKESYESNKFTHVGFSTHAAFHDNLVTAYVSSIRFSDSFLTPYDILLLPTDYFSGVQTIFLGACSGGSSKYTDENETVGVVTAFLAKKARSIVAPLCVITVLRHDRFIKLVNESGVLNSPNSWNLSDILKNPEDKEQLDYLTPFVQYANLGLVEERVEKELNALHGLFMRYVDGNLTDKENAGIKEAKEYIDNIVDVRNISLDENISDEQILAIYDEYSKRVSGSQTLGIGADLARGVENTAPFAAVVLIAALGVGNPTDLARLIMGHHVVITILGIGGQIAIEIVKKWQK